MEQQFDLKRYVSVLRRRWLSLVIPVVFVFLGAVVLAYKLPRVYEAAATILVESQQIPTDLASPTVTGKANERIQIIQQRLMTRENLLQIAAKYDLFGDERARLSPTEVVERMRAATNIAQINPGGEDRRRDETQVIGFTVAFGDENPNTAVRVTNEFVASILSQNIQTRLSRAEETSNFFKQDLSGLERKLLAMETRIAAFKRENEDALPDTLPYRRTLLLQLTGAITEIENKIQLAGLPADALDSIGNDRIRQISYRLQAKQLEFNSLREERSSLAPLAERGTVPQNRIRDLDRSIAMAELEIEAIKSEISGQDGPGGGDAIARQLEAQRAVLEQKAAAINESILKTPTVEVELNALIRDYENLQLEYREAQAKFAEAMTGERLEEDRQAEQFEVIEQATVPEEPVKPDRPRIILAGSFGSLVAGVAAVILMELVYRSIRTSADLERMLQLRPIATIPYIATTTQRRRRSLWIVAVLILIMGAIAAGLFLIHWYYLPLDLLIEKVSKNLGI